MKETPQERARRKRLKNNFNLTPDDWDQINKFQGGVCFICQKKQKSGKRLATDHGHLSGQVRGLLCSQCNRLLGRVERIWSAALMRVQEYLFDPPASRALGRDVFGFPGRCGTKRHKAWLKKQQKANQKRRKFVPIAHLGFWRKK